MFTSAGISADLLHTPKLGYLFRGWFLSRQIVKNGIPLFKWAEFCLCRFFTIFIVQMEIYRDKHEISRVIFLELENDLLTLSSYDLGGGYDEERIIEVKADLLKKAMKLDTDEALIVEMKKLYSKSEGLDLFSDFLNKHKIKFQYHRFTN